MDRIELGLGIRCTQGNTVLCETCGASVPFAQIGAPLRQAISSSTQASRHDLLDYASLALVTLEIAGKAPQEYWIPSTLFYVQWTLPLMTEQFVSSRESASVAEPPEADFPDYN